jgi:tRNA threonylcarbamoyladenosine biosynthesis protein TsaB
MKLFIDTSNSKETSVRLTDEVSVYQNKTEGRQNSQSVLPSLEKLLHDAGKHIRTIDAIEVSTGPGSFTGLRVGIGVAKVLGLLLGRTVNGKLPADEIKPDYGQNPFDK